MADHMENAVRVTKTDGLPETSPVSTPWTDAAAAGHTLTEYPRPNLVRSNWVCLNGLWDYAITRSPAAPGSWDGQILVPFSPETPLSGVRRQLQPQEYLWYRRKITVSAQAGHTLLHFGAADQTCAVFLNENEIITHIGGYLPFTADLTPFLSPDISEYTLTVRIRDVSDTSYYSRGKQKLKRGGMYYTAQSGIWQTVWLEHVPDTYINNVRITPDYDSARVRIQVDLRGDAPVSVAVLPDSEAVRKWRDHPEHYEQPPADRMIALGDGADCELSLPGFHPWSPEDPYLYRLVITAGEDRAESYFGMRCFTRETAADGYQRFFLNHRLCIGCGLLDQGYWPDGLYTAPSDDAMIYDIQTMKDLGFNTLRKHCKLEPQRWYYHCDCLGMLVWQDMVSGGEPWKDWFITYLATAMNAFRISFPDGIGTRHLFSRASKDGRGMFLRETAETVDILYNHPSIVVWVPFNEGWGQFDAAKAADTVRRADGTRLIDHASGWFDRGAGDVISRHHYFFKLRWKAEQDRILALTEYGGYTWKVPGHIFNDALYGYGGYDSRELLTAACEEKWKYCESLKTQGFSAFIYTQLSDIEDEANGILTYDRQVIKPDPDRVRYWNDLLYKE